MERLNIAILILFLFLSSQIFGQDDDLIDPVLVKLQALVISAADSSAIPYASVVLNRTHGGTITNDEGFFSLEMLNVDSLIISSVGFQKSVIKIPHNYSGNNTLVFILDPVVYLIGEIQVKSDRPEIELGLGTGKPTDIPPELRGDAFNEDPPVLAAVFNPISYWQYYLSRREKRKREVREAIIEEQYWEMHSKNYNKETVMFLTGMTDEQADSFMIWFNSLDVLAYTSTEYEVRVTIKEYFEIYKKEGRLN
ncbi:MAG: carboxypeptidase-like regulatory domain-containing protein [Bacteroidales bacterium]|jgi:hypothetical protein|nr:carboxypeptidase-like regulatory domain-containing protein [Bacteroidales bacterium]